MPSLRLFPELVRPARVIDFTACLPFFDDSRFLYGGTSNMHSGSTSTHKHTVENWAALSDEDIVSVYSLAADESERQMPFAELFLRYHDRVARWCLKFTDDRESALDLAQEVFIRAYRSLHTFRGGARFSTWMYVVARNHCLSALERNAGEPQRIDPETAGEIPDPGWSDVYSAIESRQIAMARCQTVLQALTPVEARVVMLHYGDEMPLAAISLELGLTNKSGAKAYIVSARRKLTGLVQQHHQCQIAARTRQHDQ